MLWLVEMINFISTLFAFGYGAHVSFRKNGILFLQIITCAFGCFSLGNLYNLCYFLCVGGFPNGFNIRDIGYLGGILFLFSSYYGAMDMISDNKGEVFIKYRLFALFAPVFNILVYIIGLLLLKMNLLNMSVILFVLMSSPVSYFSLKHLIIPDVDFGIIKVMRVYNLLLLVWITAQNLYAVFYPCNENLGYLLKIIISAITIFILPAASRGAKRWSI